MVVIDPDKARESILQLPKLPSETCQKELKKVIPAIVHKLYFNALLLENCFDKVFIRGTYLIKALGNYEFSHILQKLLDKVAVPALTRHLDDTLQNVNKPLAVLKLARATLELINLVYNCEYMPDSLIELVTIYLENLIKAQRGSLTNLLTDSKFQTKESKEEWKQHIEKALKTSEELRKGAMDSGRFSDAQQNPKYQKLHSQINDWNKVLQSYISTSK